MLKQQKKETMLKVARGKSQLTCNSRTFRIASNFSAESPEARKAGKEVCKALKYKNIQPKFLYTVELLFNLKKK